MRTIFERNSTAKILEAMTASFSANSDVQCLMVLGCDANGWTPGEIDPILRSLTIPVFGGIFPKIIYGQQAYEQGILVVGMPSQPEILVVPGLSNPEADYNVVLEAPSEAWMEQGTGERRYFHSVR